MRRWLLVALVLAGCHHSSSHGTTAPDLAVVHADMAAAPVDLAIPLRDPSAHPPEIPVVNHGGPTIAAMETYTIVWTGDDALGARVESFLSWLVKSDWWTTALSEYGATLGSSKGLIVIPTAAPALIDDADMAGIIDGLVSGGQIPSVNANTVLFFVFPRTTKSTMMGGDGCTTYAGYHTEAHLTGGARLAYAVNLQCSGGTFASPFDDLTVTLSHEAAEVMTDPFPFTAPAWFSDDIIAVGGEVADLCFFDNITENAPAVPDAGVATMYEVATIYSASAAKKGDSDTCKPSSLSPYFGVAIDPLLITTDGTSPVQGFFEPYAFGNVGLIKWSLIQQPGFGITVSPTSGEAQAGASVAFSVKATASAQSGLYVLGLNVLATNGQRTTSLATIAVP